MWSRFWTDILRIQTVKGDYLRYQDAVEAVSQVKGKKTRERTLYLLRKTSDSDTLTAVLGKLCKKCGLSKSLCRTVLKRFGELEISPIIRSNTSQLERLPGFCLSTESQNCHSA